MRILTTTIGLLIFNFNLLGQHQFGLKTDFGISKITSTVDDYYLSYRAQVKPSGNIGFFYDFSFGKNSYLGIDVIFMRILGNEYFEYNQARRSFQGNVFIPVVANIQSDVYRKLNYISLPIYYGLKFKKLSINLGIQPSFVVTNYCDGENYVNLSGGQVGSQKYYVRKQKLGVGSFDLGAKASLDYHVFKGFYIVANYFWGKNKLHVDSYLIKEAQIEQLTIGLKYSFINKEKSKKE